MSSGSGRLMGLVACWAAVGMVFAGPISRALFNVAALFMLMAWLLWPEGRQSALRALRNPITLPTLTLFAIVVLGMTYSSAPLRESLDHLRAYWRLPAIVLLLMMFRDPEWRQKAWWAFVIAMAITLGSTFVGIWVELPWARMMRMPYGYQWGVFSNYVAQGLATSIFAALCCQKALDAKDRRCRAAWLAAAVLAFCSVFFLLIGRTGALALGAVVVVFCVKALDSRWRRRMLWAVPVLLLAAAYLSPSIGGKFRLIPQELATADVAGESSSVGLRWQMFMFSIRLIAESPIWGHGTGAYHVLAAAKMDHCEWTCTHPHSQFLFLAVEHGLLGLGAFCLMLHAMYREGRRQAQSRCMLPLSVFAVLLVDSSINVPLWYWMESNVFCPLIALVMAAAGSQCQDAVSAR